MRHDLRQEPYAVVPHVRICAGGAGQPASLPQPLLRLKINFLCRVGAGGRCRGRPILATQTPADDYLRTAALPQEIFQKQPISDLDCPDILKYA